MAIESARDPYPVEMDAFGSHLLDTRYLQSTRRAAMVSAVSVASGLIAASAAACAPWTAAPPTTPGARLQHPITYVAMGASDAAGVGVDRPSVDGWVPVLGRLLPPPVRVVNLGIPGIRLREASIVETGPTVESKPNLITVWLVVNDILNSVAVDAYKADLDELLTRLKAETAAEIAVGNVPDAPDGSGSARPWRNTVRRWWTFGRRGRCARTRGSSVPTACTPPWPGTDRLRRCFVTHCGPHRWCSKAGGTDCS